MDVEAAELLLLLRFSGDGERARDELVEQTSHHFQILRCVTQVWYSEKIWFEERRKKGRKRRNPSCS